jgi:cell division protein FtsW (lipid II flippase)
MKNVWLLSALLLSLQAQGQAPLRAQLLNILARASTIECTLGQGSATRWLRKGEIDVQPVEFGENGFFIISNINYQNRTADIHWPEFSHEATLIPGESGVSLIYSPDQGSLFVTTIFADITSQNPTHFKVTHSRHLFVRERAMPSQYSGHCLVN